MDSLLGRATLPAWISIAIALLSLGIAWGSATTSVHRLEDRVTEIEQRGTIPSVRLEEKVDGIRGEIQEIRKDIRSLSVEVRSR